jgi:hypothetical protein
MRGSVTVLTALLLCTAAAKPQVSTAQLQENSCNQRIAFGLRTATGRILFDRGDELWVMDGDGQHQRPILAGADWAALSPDGNQVAYCDERDKTIRVLSLVDGCTAVIDNLERQPMDIA